MTDVETVIVGAGQAGLATAQRLRSRGRECVVFERSQQIGDNWRQQWDSLRLYTPARFDGLPGTRFPADPWTFPTKDAVADYLHNARPACTARNVFIRAKAPRRALGGPSAVSCVVCRALRRAEIDAPVKGAHLLRHSLATQMLGNGASLGEIAEILRHRNPQTTTIYAKVDLSALRALALPWPGGAQ